MFVDKDFVVWSRALVIQRWMAAQPRESEFWMQAAPGPTIALYEPDMLFLRWKEEAFTAKAGVLRAPEIGYMTVKTPEGKAFVNNFCKRNCDKVLPLDAPWILHRDALWDLLTDWLTITRTIRTTPPFQTTWVADMWGIMFASVHSGLSHEHSTDISCHCIASQDKWDRCAAAAMHYTWDFNLTHVHGRKAPYYFFSKRWYSWHRPKYGEIVPPPADISPDGVIMARNMSLAFIILVGESLAKYFPDDARAADHDAAMKPLWAKLDGEI